MHARYRSWYIFVNICTFAFCISYKKTLFLRRLISRGAFTTFMLWYFDHFLDFLKMFRRAKCILNHVYVSNPYKKLPREPLLHLYKRITITLRLMEITSNNGKLGVEHEWYGSSHVTWLLSAKLGVILIISISVE